MPELATEYYLPALVDKFEGKFAVLSVADQSVKWPIKSLPDDIEVGKEIRLCVSSQKAEKEAQEKIAIQMLNQLLES